MITVNTRIAIFLARFISFHLYKTYRLGRVKRFAETPYETFLKQFLSWILRVEP
jgi:hypothetical protein